MNDYPALAREKATDADRVYPGDGIPRRVSSFARLHAIWPYNGFLSLEIFDARLLEARRPDRCPH